MGPQQKQLHIAGRYEWTMGAHNEHIAPTSTVVGYDVAEFRWIRAAKWVRSTFMRIREQFDRKPRVWPPYEPEFCNYAIYPRDTEYVMSFLSF